MEAIKTIRVDNTDYLLKATYDSSGNDITKTYSTKKELQDSIPDLSQYAQKINIVNVSDIQEQYSISPNILYKFGEKSSLDIVLTPGDSNIYNEYMFEFISGATPTVLSIQGDIKWITDNTIESSKTYQVSIINNLAVLGESEL